METGILICQKMCLIGECEQIYVTFLNNTFGVRISQCLFKVC